MIKVWGMISAQDEEAGFDVGFDNKWRVILMNRGEVVAVLDPREYSAVTELQDDLVNLIRDTDGRVLQRGR